MTIPTAKISETFFHSYNFCYVLLQVGGPYWDVPVGRKDSVTAGYDLAALYIPTPNESLLSIISKFLYQGLSVTDMVALSGKQAPLKDIYIHIFYIDTYIYTHTHTNRYLVCGPVDQSFY